MPEWFPDEPGQVALQSRYQEDLCGWIAEAAREADERMVPARIGAGRGECRIGVYRRETDPDGEIFLGEVPGHPTDPDVGVLRVDNLDGRPVATVFSYGCHPVTIGPRSMVASPDFPGAARTLVESAIGGLSLFLQGCGREHHAAGRPEHGGRLQGRKRPYRIHPGGRSRQDRRCDPHPQEARGTPAHGIAFPAYPSGPGSRSPALRAPVWPPRTRAFRSGSSTCPRSPRPGPSGRNATTHGIRSSPGAAKYGNSS